jgi:NAD(P)-dependent dehydrogenase (short-subunit alcohol dehydrogenase family)
MNETAVVTGGTRGMGKEIVGGLLRSGVTVIIGVRNAKLGEAVSRELAKEPGGGGIEVFPLDLSSMASVRAFADAVSAKHPTIQLLINNAGAWFNERSRSIDGRELTLATNVLGPYLLTKLLLPQLRAGAPARIVNLSSSAVGDYDPNDVEFKQRTYDSFKAYKQSKQITRMITWKLAERLDGSGVVVNTVDPGAVKTDFLNSASGFSARLMAMVVKVIGITPEQGAATTLWVAQAPELADVSGRFFVSKKEKDGGFRDRAALDQLEKLLDGLTGTTTPESLMQHP